MVENLRNINVLESRDLSKFKVGYFLSVVEDLPLKEPMNLPFGKIISRPSGVLAVTVDVDGKVSQGYGEGATLPEPLFTDDCGETISKASEEILKSFQGKGKINLVDAFKYISEYSFSDNKRYPTARMMVEMALFDGYAKAKGISVGEIFGLSKDIKSVKYGKSIGEGSSAEIIRQCSEAGRNGARKLKLKISPDYMFEVLDAIDLIKKSKQFDLMVDANGSFDPENAKHVEMLASLDKQGLIMIEEPVSRVGIKRGIDAVMELRRKVNFKTPICLDDSLVDMETTLFALNTNLADVVNIKPGRIGSIINSVKLARYCRSIGKEIMVGGMLEATPGRCMTATLAAIFESMGFKIPGDLSLAQERLSKDIVSDENQLHYNERGEVVLPKENGWGFGEISLAP